MAIAADAALARDKRVAIVNFDVHHGNGTQDLLYDEPNALFISLHRYGGFYPGTGAEHERGQGLGEGTTINICLPQGADGVRYVNALDQIVEPALAHFDPELLLVSAGFDAHIRDPLGGQRLEDADFEVISARLAALRGVTAADGGQRRSRVAMT